MQLTNKKLLVFPTSRAIRDFIKKEKNSNKLLPSFLTIDEFLKKSISIFDKRFIDEEERFLFLKEASNIKLLDKLGISNNFTSFLKQSDYLFRFFGELSSEKISINDIKTSDTYEFYSEHIDILNEIYNNYINILEKNSCVDKINIVNNYKINKEFIKKYESIDIYFEGYFTKFELDIIIEISKYKDLNLYLSSNKYNQKSIQSFIDIGFELELDHNYKINLHNKKILKKEPLVNSIESIDITAFSSRINQIAYIKNSIVQIVNSGIDVENIALILPDEKFAKTLQLFDNEKYFNYAMGLDIFNSSFYKCLNSINNYLNEEEKKSLESLEFYSIDKLFIDDNFKNVWNKKLNKEIFEKFLSYIISFESNKEIQKKVDELTYKFYNLLFKENQNISFKETVKIFIQKVSKITLDDVNSGVITVMGLLESRAVSFDAVIICDFNEEYIPKKSIKDKFLSSSLKKHAKLPTQNDRENLQKYYYSKLIYAAKKVFISYVSNETSQISRFASLLFEKNIINRVSKDKEYKQILFSNKKISHFDKEIIEKIDLSKQEWSATSLKKYLECKRKYYLEYIVGIKEHSNSLKPKGYELGSLVHNSLEELYTKYDKYNVSYELLLKIFEQKAIENPFLLLDKEIFKKRMEDFILLDKKRFGSGVEIISLEKSFNFVYKGIKLKGAIDRIDKNGDTYEIIDYKTSSSLKIDSIKNYENSSDFQLEFYFLASKELFSYEKIKTFYYDLYNVTLNEEIALFQKLELLEHIFEDLKTKEVNFEKCESNSTCQFCDFKTICDR